MRSSGLGFLALVDEETFPGLSDNRLLSGLPDVTKGMVQAIPSPSDVIGPFKSQVGWARGQSDGWPWRGSFQPWVCPLPAFCLGHGQAPVCGIQ